MSPVALTQADTGKTVPVSLGSLITVCLAENPTTGYRWEMGKLDAKLVTLVNSAYAPAPGGGIGSGGERTFTFKAVGAGRCPLRLKLWRAWEGDKSVTKRFEASIEI
jgi:inhibitor of cysteine peptidase